MKTALEYLKENIEQTNMPEEHWENEIAEMMEWYADYKTEQLTLGVVVGQSEQLVADFTIIVGKEAHHYKDGEVIKREKLKFSN